MDLCQQLKEELDSIDKQDKVRLRQFFKDYFLLDDNDMAHATGYSSRVIKKYRHNCGMYEPSGRQTHKDIEIPPELISGVDSYEDTKEWWEKHYDMFGYRKLARLAGLRYPHHVKDKLAKHKIPLKGQRKPKKDHPCNNYEWLYKYYVQQRYNASKVARLAGVARSTLCNWLAKHKIPQRRDVKYVGDDPSV